MSRLGKVGIILVAAVSGFILYLIAVKAAPLSNALGAEGQVASLSTKISVYVVILCGVAIGSSLRWLIHAHKTGSEASPVRVIKESISGFDFTIGIIGSPILYGLLVSHIERAPTDVFYWLAFQNGLFAPLLISQFLDSPAPGGASEEKPV